MEKLRIIEVFETIERHNPVSGHRWSEQGDSIGFEVTGGRWVRARFKTLAAAERDKAIKESINKKFPLKKDIL